MGMSAEGIYHSNEHFLHTKNYLDLTKKYQRQEWMIFGEASVFIVSLVIGIWLINRGYNKEIEIAHQRRNFLLSINLVAFSKTQGFWRQPFNSEKLSYSSAFDALIQVRW